MNLRIPTSKFAFIADNVSFRVFSKSMTFDVIYNEILINDTSRCVKNIRLIVMSVSIKLVAISMQSTT